VTIKLNEKMGCSCCKLICVVLISEYVLLCLYYDSSFVGRGRENKENEKNLEEGREGYRRGGGRMMNGPGRSGRGGRAGGRLGPRTFQNRDKGGFPRSIDTWNNPGAGENAGESLKMGKLI
jgi:hypothetical protein